MSGAVPYDPDDFDNNPFAESSIIIQPPAQQQTDTTFDDNDKDKETVGPISPRFPQSPFVSQGAIPSMTGNDHAQSSLPPMPDHIQPSDLNKQQPPTPEQPEHHEQQQPNLPPKETTTKQNEEEELNSTFHHYPTDLDLKKYLPERLNRGSFSLAVKVIEVEKNGNSGYKNPIIKFNATVKNIPGFRRSTYKEVRRSYKEIESLYKYLIFNNIEVFVPAVPDIPLLYNSGSLEFLTAFTKSVQNWFNRVCLNPILIRNQEFVLFFEQNDFCYTPSKTKPSSNSVMATGIKRKTLKQFQPPFDASQELAEYRPLIKSIFVQSQKLLEKLDKLMKFQKQSSSASLDVYHKLGELGSLESEKDMIRMWTKFQKVMKVYDELNLVKEVSFSAGLAENFKLISDDCYNIKESLTNRHLLMRELLNAEENTKKKLATINKLKVKPMIDPLKVDEAVRSLELASNYDKELKYQVKRTTYEMLIEAQDYLNYMTASIKQLFKR
ncbi:unnamed protein product [Ambrosiozyma monospora]|uniref:Unnamed protein product n=1 Tax=Ambrosiozyma monospora TaxID=43982 RepID=A0ACB5T7G2_AMBMO|nr:unnamed protein product [Ambrosiozyma monospora]